MTSNGLLEHMTIKAAATTKRAGIELAVARGHLRTREGPRRSVLHEYVSD